VEECVEADDTMLCSSMPLYDAHSTTVTVLLDQVYPSATVEVGKVVYALTGTPRLRCARTGTYRYLGGYTYLGIGS